jgi:hypothetical protein
MRQAPFMPMNRLFLFGWLALFINCTQIPKYFHSHVLIWRKNKIVILMLPVNNTVSFFGAALLFSMAHIDIFNLIFYLCQYWGIMKMDR